MTLSLTFDELLQVIRKKTSQPITLRTVSADTVQVGTTINLYLTTKDVHINLRLLKIEGTDLRLSYSGGWGLDIVVGKVLQQLNSKDEYRSIFEQHSNNQLLIHLAAIPQLQPVLNALTLQDAYFTDNTLTLHATME